MSSKHLFRIIFVLLVAIVQYRCANESVPQGGKKDTTPPKAKKIDPPNKSLHFNSDQIQITFNKFIKATGFTQTLVSPPLDKKPVYKIKGKTLIIKFKSPLRDSTTYTINFADDIQDVNEGNKAPNFTYVFSTGSFIDSQKISGKVILAEDNSPQEGIVVSLYPPDSINAVKRSKPFYFAKTDKSGQFQIQNIKAGNYLVYALKDQNYNYIYDQPNEMISFSDSIYHLEDSITPNVELLLFDENKKKLAIEGINSLAPGCLQISYTKPIKSFKLTASFTTDSDISYFNSTKDTLTYWFSNYYLQRAHIYMVANDTLNDSAKIELNFIDKDSIFTKQRYALSISSQAITARPDTSKKINSNIQELYKPLRLLFTRPVIGINNSKTLTVTNDSTKKTVPLNFLLDEKTKQFILASFDKYENTPYTVLIPDSTFRDIFGTWNHKTVYKFQTNSKDNYGNIHLTLKAQDPDKYYLIKLMTLDNEVIKEFSFTGGEERKEIIENLLAGTYKFMVIDDRNRNGKWDTGNLLKKLQPEKVYTFKDTYQLKGGWDLDVEVKF